MLEDKGAGLRKLASGSIPCDPDHDRRKEQRHIAVFRVGKLMTPTGQEFCLVRNISPGGLMANVYTSHAVGEPIAIELKAGAVVRGLINWVREDKIGVTFDEKIDVDHVLSNIRGDVDEFQARLPRIEIRCPARLRVGARYQRVELCDIAQGGAKITTTEIVAVGDEVVLSIDGLPPQAGSIRWASDGRAGIAFHTAIPFGTIAAWATRHY